MERIEKSDISDEKRCNLEEEKRMSIMNGVWHDAALDLPPAHETVLAVKEKKKRGS